MQPWKNIFNTLATSLFLVVPMSVTNYFCHSKKSDTKNQDSAIALKEWKAPDTSQIGHTVEGDLIRYGRTLIIHTADFFGPRGSIAFISNGMNCGNCHINAGTRMWVIIFLWSLPLIQSIETEAAKLKLWKCVSTIVLKEA